MGLLDLPSELLFAIIGLVANSSIRPPPAGKRHRLGQLHNRSIVCVPTTHHPWLYPTRSLLLSCKRLNSETITYHAKAAQTMILDVAIVDNHWIWPCFISMPGAFGYVLESLIINLTYCCTEEERGAYNSDIPKWSYEGDFVEVISNLLRSGSSSLSSSSMGSRSNFRIKTITINLDTKSVDKGNEPLSEETVPYRQIDKLAHLSFDPLYSIDLLACSKHLDWLGVSIDRLLHQAHLLRIIFERVDQIQICIDFKLRKTLDLADRQSRREEKRLEVYRQRNRD